MLAPDDLDGAALDLMTSRTGIHPLGMRRASANQRSASLITPLRTVVPDVYASEGRGIATFDTRDRQNESERGAGKIAGGRTP